MQRDLDPVEACGGGVSGRAFLLPLASAVGPVIARGLAWLLFIQPH